MEENKQQNILRNFFQSEITWLIGLIMALMAFTYNIIIPLNALQLQLAQIQRDISDLKGYDERITNNSNDIIVIKEQLKRYNIK